MQRVANHDFANDLVGNSAYTAHLHVDLTVVALFYLLFHIFG